MQPTSTAFSPRLGLAIAAGVTGLLLAGGITVATLVGWVQPAQSAAVSVQSAQPAATSANLSDSAVAAPQVVLVPVMPAGATVQTAPSAPNVELPVGLDGRPPQDARNETFGRLSVQEDTREHGYRVARGLESDRYPTASARTGRGHADDD
jgi:hypothetical protein